jgi:hypothetical protein
MSLERGPLSLVSTNEELLGRKSSGSGLENREYGRRDQLYWPRNTFYLQELALTSLTSGGHSVGIVSSGNKATEFVVFVYYYYGYILTNITVVGTVSYYVYSNSAVALVSLPLHEYVFSPRN